MTRSSATVALTEKHRSSIYQHLAPQWGDEVTQAFLSQFPARDGEEPITRDYLRAEMADLRGELRDEISDLRGELRDEMAGLRGEMHQIGSHLAGLVITVAGVLAAVVIGAATVIIALT